MNQAQAEEFTKGLEDSTRGSWRLVKTAVELGVPKALGLTTEQWVQKIGGYIRLAREERKEAALELAAEGKSTREIAGVLGTDHSTVVRDLAGANAPSAIFDSTEFGQLNVDAGANAPDERRAENAEQVAAIKAQPIIRPQNKYRCLVVDPPWPMKKIDRDVRPNQVGFDYPTMSEEELFDWPDAMNRADEQCHLWLWTTQKFLPTAFRCSRQWGFDYLCTFVWHKPGGFQPVGLPQYNCEFVLLCRKNGLEFLDTKDFKTCFEAPRREHSRKPDEFYDLVRRVSPETRLDMFSREKRDGFDQYGNEVGKFA